MSKNISYCIDLITEKDSEEVVQFLRKFYFRDEPINAAIELLHESNDTCEEYEKYCIRCIPEGLSIKAVSSNGHLLGLCINASCTKDNYNYEQDLIKNCLNPKFTKILQLMVTANKQSNIFGLFPTTEKVFDSMIISVDVRYRCQGIGRALLQKTKEIVEDRRFPLFKADCTSNFTAKALSSLGFHCVSTLKYDDFVNERGEKIFDVDFPHIGVKTFVMSLNV